MPGRGALPAVARLVGLLVLSGLATGCGDGMGPLLGTRRDAIPELVGSYTVTHANGEAVPATVDTVGCQDANGDPGVIRVLDGTLVLRSDSSAIYELWTLRTCVPGDQPTLRWSVGLFRNVMPDSTVTLHFDGVIEPFVDTRVVPGGAIESTFREPGLPGTQELFTRSYRLTFGRS